MVKLTVELVRAGIAMKELLANFPSGQQVSAAGADREFLLLDPGTAAKLPACLLVAVVLFFHADLSISQIYAGVATEAFAKADVGRRMGYLNAFEEVWRKIYQPAAFSALFRLALYVRLRAWSI